MNSIFKKVTVICASVLLSASIGFAQVKVASNGYVGIGTTSPITKFQIGNIWTFYDGGSDKEICRNARWQNNQYWRTQTGVSSLISFKGNGDILFKTAPSGNAGSAITNFSNVIIKNNGTVGIGTTTPTTTNKLHVVGNTQFSGNVLFDVHWTDVLLDYQVFDSLGRPVLYPERNWYLQLGRADRKLGDVYASHVMSNQYTTLPCDERVKENITRVDNAIERIKRISGYRYNVKKDFFADIPEKALANLTKPTFGFIAQELEKEFPEVVVKFDSEKASYGVNYMEMIPVLLEAIKEQQTMIETLQKEVQSLQTINSSLKSGEIEST
ncbi:MAG: tail fiber domain-containing protein, partial [Bacteroidales bacterium]|nr:tail fiber domain-containing protein [Bacteroidales bacterium]